MFSRSQRRATRLQLQTDKKHGERSRLPRPATYYYLRWSSFYLRRWQHHKVRRRSCQHQSRRASDAHLIGVRIAAKSVARYLKAITHRRNSRRQRHFLRASRNFTRRENNGCQAPGASFNRRKNHARIQRRHKQSPPSCVRRNLVTVRENHRYTGRQSPVYVQHRQRRAFPGNDLSRQQQYPRSGSRGSLLLCPAEPRFTTKYRQSNDACLNLPPSYPHTAIVVDFSLPQKCPPWGITPTRTSPYLFVSPARFRLSFPTGQPASVANRRVITWMQCLS